MAGKNKDASLNKRAFTSGFFFILAQLFARGLTFAVTPVYSRLLTKAQYGVVRTYESWLLIAYTIMSLCLWRSVDVAKKDFEDDYNGYVSSVHTLSYIAIAFFILNFNSTKLPHSTVKAWRINTPVSKPDIHFRYGF